MLHTVFGGMLFSSLISGTFSIFTYYAHDMISHQIGNSEKSGSLSIPDNIEVVEFNISPHYDFPVRGTFNITNDITGELKEFTCTNCNAASTTSRLSNIYVTNSISSPIWFNNTAICESSCRFESVSSSSSIQTDPGKCEKF